MNDLTSRKLFPDQADATGRRSRRPIFVLDGWNDRQRMGFQPKLARQTDWFQAGGHPPISFLAGAVQLAMMRPAQRYCKFVADLLAEPAGLCKAQMVGVTRLTAADKAGLARHEAQVLPVSLAFGLRQG